MKSFFSSLAMVMLVVFIFSGSAVAVERPIAVFGDGPVAIESMEYSRNATTVTVVLKKNIRMENQVMNLEPQTCLWVRKFECSRNGLLRLVLPMQDCEILRKTGIWKEKVL